MYWRRASMQCVGYLLAVMSMLAPVQAIRMLETSALLSCQSNSQFQATSFNVQFFPDNSSAQVSLSAQSTIEGNFTAVVELYAYGIKVITESINSCKVSNTLCPISAGHFEVDTSFNDIGDITKEIPGIAYTMPDIDAVVRVRIHQQDEDGTMESDSIACVEAVVSNGKTVQTKYASWGLFGVITLGLVIAGIVTLMGHISTASHITSNVVSLLAYFQTIAIIGMMAVHKMPPIAAAWVQNFVWTVGIISTKFMQDIMSWYVRSTGGSSTNILANKNIISIAVYKHRKRALEAAGSMMRKLQMGRGIEVFNYVSDYARRSLFKRVDIDTAYSTTNEKDPSLVSKTLVLQGIKRVAYLANIELSNFFLTGATFFILVGLVLVLFLGTVKVVLELMVLLSKVHKGAFKAYRDNWRMYTKGVLFRYFLIGFTQLSVLCLWEFTDAASVATVVDAAVIYAVVVACLGYASFKVITLARKSTKLFESPAYILYGNTEVLNRWGFLYVQFRATAYYFLLPLLAYNFIKAAVIAFGQSNGKVQAVIIFVTELVYLVVLCWIKPFMDKKTNGFNIAIQVIMFINSIFFLFFSQLFGEKADVASSICGVVFFILNAIFSLVLLIMIVIACIWALIRRDPDARYQPMRDDRQAFMVDNREKRNNNELDDLGFTARDGYRESRQFYGDEPVAGRTISDSSDEPPTAATRLPTNPRDQDLDTDYPTYREHQSGAAGGAFQRPLSYNNDYSASLLNQPDHSNQPYGNHNYGNHNYGGRYS